MVKSLDNMKTFCLLPSWIGGILVITTYQVRTCLSWPFLVKHNYQRGLNHVTLLIKWIVIVIIYMNFDSRHKIEKKHWNLFPHENCKSHPFTLVNIWQCTVKTEKYYTSVWVGWRIFFVKKWVWLEICAWSSRMKV